MLSGEIRVTWHMPDFFLKLGPFCSLVPPLLLPEAQRLLEQALPDTLLPGTQMSTEGPVVAWGGLPVLAEVLCAGDGQAPPLLSSCLRELTFPGAEEIKQTNIIVHFD